MKILELKFLLDQKDLAFIDLKVSSDCDLKKIHLALMEACKWSGNEMASVYLLDEDQEVIEEFPVEAFDPAFKGRKMNEVQIGELVGEIGDQLMYLYDYLKEFKFFIECTAVSESSEKNSIEIAQVFGKIPKEDKDNISGKSAESILMNAILGDEFDLDDEDENEGDDLFDQGSFDSIDDYEDFL